MGQVHRKPTACRPRLQMVSRSEAPGSHAVRADERGFITDDHLQHPLEEAQLQQTVLGDAQGAQRVPTGGG